MTGRVLESEEEIEKAVRSLKRVAVLGVKPDTHSAQPAHAVPAYLQARGIEIVPVPTRYPEAERILGVPVKRELSEIEGPVDAVDVFRKASDLPGHLEALIALRPPLVWLQLGIRDDAFARALTEAGIDVVQDRCLMVDHRRYAR